jgi:hypothetical protein
MTGQDGMGNAYTQGDSLVLSVKGIQTDGNLSPDSVSIYLGLNSTILDNWQTFNFTSLGSVIGIRCSISSSDTWTPYYFCMDNIITTESNGFDSENNINVSFFPNPASDFIQFNGLINASVQITDLTGKVLTVQNDVSYTTKIDVSRFKPGFYIINADENGKKMSNTLLIL